MTKIRKSPRKYTEIEQFFHKGTGETHLSGVKHIGDKHIIAKRYAKGQDQWFRFTERVGNGFDLSSGKKVDVNEVPNNYKK